MAYLYLNIAITLNATDDSVRAEQYYLKAIGFAKKLNLKNVEAYAYSNVASLYADKNRRQEQYDYSVKAVLLAKDMGDQGIEASSLSRAADALAHMNKLDEAEKMSRESLAVADSSAQPINIYQAYYGMGKILEQKKEYARAIYYFEKAFHSLSDADLYDDQVGYSYLDLSECYEQTGDFKKALAAYKTSTKILDSVASKDNVRKVTELNLNYEFQKKQQVARAEQDKKDAIAQRTRSQQYLIIAALGVAVLAVVIIALIQYRNNKHKQKANALLQQQKEKVESTLSKLKSTQTQLIHSEKMASLGELTAGIAHEIQNPLNFVNNFSEVSNELVDEMNIELNKGDVEEAKIIANNIKQNLEKINHHGKRADAIVKGMLQHSRKSSGQKELTNINALCDEYLRLSYHGLRAKDKSFNADFKTDFDESIGKINIVPQDIGRVLLNLFNNAFYAVNEKKKLIANSYQPMAEVKTRLINDKVEITVSDNGNGIPQNIIDKIFQPFFTTKPTGEGTGLGLSLAYDIITKEHNGTIKVESKKGEGSIFIIQLPYANHQ
jgi:signal transduction histidine kinase